MDGTFEDGESEKYSGFGRGEVVASSVTCKWTYGCLGILDEMADGRLIPVEWIGAAMITAS
jgi:hypothetical protein